MNTEMLSFVEEQAAKLTHDDIVALASRLPALRARAARIAVLEYPQLPAQYEFLALLVEDCSQFLDGKVSGVCDREMAFALLYFEQEDGLLPDATPGFGLVDDQAVVETVLYKHREALRHSPRGYLFQWAVEPVDIDRMMLDRLHHQVARLRAGGFSGTGRLARTSEFQATH